MKRAVWITDIHLNFLTPQATALFLEQVQAARPDAVLLSGDTAEAPDVIEFLEQIGSSLSQPVYFVLGNHDFYLGSIRQVRELAVVLTRRRKNLVYLSASEVHELTPRVGLIGHDGWADARIGDYEHSMVMMNDYLLIEELAGFSKAERRPHLRALGDETAAHIRRVLPLALARYPQVILLTHVPPFREACWHEGQISDDEWAPHFTCKALGDVLLEIMPQYPDHTLTVLCGHTHSPGKTRPLDNLLILTGGATYGQPEVQRVFELK